MKKLLYLIILALPTIGFTQPGSEIYLFDIDPFGTDISVSNPVNITNHVGYDSQPFFHKTEPIIYYASFNEDGRSDIKTYNYKTEKTTSFTTTSEREYSPTSTPDGKFVSCIIQRDNDAQDLGKYPIDGGEAITIIDNLSVGYHSWVDHDNLILFVLGDTFTLRWYDLKNQQDRILAENIGRSFHHIPGEKAMSFIDKQSEKDWVIKRLDNKTQKITVIAPTVLGSEDLTWTPDGRILMSDGDKLFIYNPKSAEGWSEITMNNDNLPVQGITRLAISPDGKRLAVVVSE